MHFKLKREVGKNPGPPFHRIAFFCKKAHASAEINVKLSTVMKLYSSFRILILYFFILRIRESLVIPNDSAALF